ncbi:unnamed protein product [Ostreobium quekettii]|uniref:RING-type E3 ubiquitin transferase n=1 Tax=Ostreobium quekettii TaxID=121088 RepID=A0A8S1IWF3_9CHLO|nr:unnamed protein product [Ostreobium quekettii]|eukprot:evm.model.scf_188.4 EVM.evm.TU.scf_188.4   scf_188:37212-40093(+)
MAAFDSAAIESQLRKKISFEAGVRSLEAFLSGPFESAPEADRREALRLVGRAHALLKSRHSAVPFWTAGRQLFSTAKDVARGMPGEEQFGEYFRGAEAFIAEMDGPSTSAAEEGPRRPQQRRPYLFEGQLTEADAAPPPDPLANIGRVIQLMVPEVAEMLTNQPRPPPPPQDPAAGPHPADPTRAPSPIPDNPADTPSGQIGPDFHEQLRRTVEMMDLGAGLQAHGIPGDAADVPLEEVLRMLAAEGDAQGPAPPPPASKAAVAGLPRAVVTEEGLAMMGTKTSCPVCFDDYAPGQEVQTLPCGHVLHPGCLAPWLETTNSCPVCRHELPTDDREYEERKERRAAEEEERRGAANAVDHTEFLYI